VAPDAGLGAATITLTDGDAAKATIAVTIDDAPDGGIVGNPREAHIHFGDSLRLTAVGGSPIAGTCSTRATDYSWSQSGLQSGQGSYLTSDGFYQSGYSSYLGSVTDTMTVVDGAGHSATVNVHVDPAPAAAGLSINVNPDITNGNYFCPGAYFTATGGAGGYVWTMTPYNIPSGMDPGSITPSGGRYARQQWLNSFESGSVAVTVTDLLGAQSTYYFNIGFCFDSF
jgi:hypothetical protein